MLTGELTYPSLLSSSRRADWTESGPRGRLERIWPACETTPSSVPAFLLFPSFSSPSSRSHLQPHGLLTEMESQAQTPSLQKLRIPKRRGSGSSLHVYRTAFATTEGAPVAEGLYPRRQTALKTEEKKMTETEARSPLATAYACTVPGGRIPAKFGFQPIKLELYPLEHTYSAKYVRVHFRPLGVYKESRVAYRAT